jgi:hypothetical protein
MDDVDAGSLKKAMCLLLLCDLMGHLEKGSGVHWL